MSSGKLLETSGNISYLAFFRSVQSFSHVQSLALRRETSMRDRDHAGALLCTLTLSPENLNLMQAGERACMSSSLHSPLPIPRCRGSSLHARSLIPQRENLNLMHAGERACMISSMHSHSPNPHLHELIHDCLCIGRVRSCIGLHNVRSFFCQ